MLRHLPGKQKAYANEESCAFEETDQHVTGGSHHADIERTREPADTYQPIVQDGDRNEPMADQARGWMLVDAETGADA